MDHQNGPGTFQDVVGEVWYATDTEIDDVDRQKHNTQSEKKGKVAQSCPTLCDPMDYAVRGILQARILEWVAVPFSRGSSQPREWTQVSSLQVDSLPAEPQGEPIHKTDLLLNI